MNVNLETLSSVRKEMKLNLILKSLIKDSGLEMKNMDSGSKYGLMEQNTRDTFREI